MNGTVPSYIKFTSRMKVSSCTKFGSIASVLLPIRKTHLCHLATCLILPHCTFVVGPTEAPKLQVIDMYGYQEMLLIWEPISKAGARGEVLGYRIQYWLTELQETPIIQKKVYAVSIFAPNRTKVLKGLQPFARYHIRIQAFTEGGFGVWSQELDGGDYTFFASFVISLYCSLT